MFNFLTKFIFYFKRPQVIIVTGNGRAAAVEAIFRVLEQHFKVRKVTDDVLPWVRKNEILVFESKIKETKIFEFIIKKSRLPILVLTHVGEWHPDREFFAGDIEQVKEITRLAEALPGFGYIILNFDDETVRDIKNKSRAHSLTFGFGARADFRVTDIVFTPDPSFGINFKINYKGNIVPIWLKNLFGKEQVYTALAITAVGRTLDLNLVEISEALKFYQGLPGKMRLIKGIKNSWILDDSASSSSLSMMEALEILGKIEAKRKVAVLGDVMGVGKYTIEAHEAIGRKAGLVGNLLFTVGARAKFIAEGAIIRGVPEDRMFKFDEADQAAKTLQEEIQEGDLILIDGSKEMEMEKIVDEIKAI